MTMDFTLPNGITFFFNGKPPMDRIEAWVLFAKLKRDIVEKQDTEYDCPLCKHKLYSCDCLKEAANNILQSRIVAMSFCEPRS